MNKRFFLGFFLLFLFLSPGTGEAFIPQAPHLLHLMIAKIKQPVGIEAFQTKKILNYEETGESFVTADEKLIYLYPNRFRSETISDTMISFSVESDFEFVRVMDGIIVSRKKALVDLYTDILLYRDHESLLNHLVVAGIDTTKVSLQRYNDTICYVIGRSLVQGESYPGLWIEKDTFLPVKYVAEENGILVEFFYENWQRVSKTLYPMLVNIFRGNQLFAVVHVKKFNLKSGFSPFLFDVEHILQLYPENNTDSFDENSRQVDELDKSMEKFKKLYE